jgi:hypothetical protein
MAIGFIAIFTTGLFSFAGKSLQLSSRQINHAGAYQVCEAMMEDYHRLAQVGDTFDTIVAVPDYTFATHTNSEGELVVNREFVYTVSVVDLTDEMKKVQVRVFVASHNGEDPAPHPDHPRGGEVVRMTNFYNKP